MRKKLDTETSIGADECAWGNLAGPFFCCAVAMTPNQSVAATSVDSKKIKDFTKLSALVRRNIEHVTAHSLVTIDADLLIKLGYARAREFAFQCCVARVRRKVAPRFPLATIDGSSTFGIRRARAIEKADAQFRTVGMASCIAKSKQLAYMLGLHRQYPEYGFDSHAGYGTPQHIEALVKYGAIPHIHRIPVINKMFRNRNLTLKIRSN